MTRLSSLATSLFVLLLAACGNDDPVVVTINDLAGDWVGEEFRFTSADDPEVTFDLIEAGGRFDFTVDQDGFVVGTIELFDFDTGGVVPIPTTATMSIVEPGFVDVDFALDEGPFQFPDGRLALELTGDLMIVRSEEAAFFFAGNPAVSDAVFVGRFRRTN